MKSMPASAEEAEEFENIPAHEQLKSSAGGVPVKLHEHR